MPPSCVHGTPVPTQSLTLLARAYTRAPHSAALSHSINPAAAANRSRARTVTFLAPLGAPLRIKALESAATRTSTNPATAPELSFSAQFCPFPFRHPTPVRRREMATQAAAAAPTPAEGATTDPNATGSIGVQTPDAVADNQSTSGVTPESLEHKLRTALEATEVSVEDISGGCGQSFAATIVSAKFDGKTTLARHRLVNGALRDEISRIHAWTPKCLTPKEWAKKQGN